MARPLKAGLDFFRHDCDAMTNERLAAMQAMFRNDGYAFFFKLLERIYRSENFTLDISKSIIRSAIIKAVGVSEKRFGEMLNEALELGLFDKEAYTNFGFLTSGSIQKRASIVVDKREMMQQNYRKKKDSEAETKEETFEETGEETLQSREEEKISEDSAGEYIETWNRQRRSNRNSQQLIPSYHKRLE